MQQYKTGYLALYEHFIHVSCLELSEYIYMNEYFFKEYVYTCSFSNLPVTLQDSNEAVQTQRSKEISLIYT